MIEKKLALEHINIPLPPHYGITEVDGLGTEGSTTTWAPCRVGKWLAFHQLVDQEAKLSRNKGIDFGRSIFSADKEHVAEQIETAKSLLGI